MSKKIGLGLAALGATVLLMVGVTHYQQAAAPAVELYQRAPSADQAMRQRIMTDRMHLAMDEKRYAQMIAHERAARQVQLVKYGDGCDCNCPASGCDEEKHEGPVCNCPGQKAGGMPPPFAPFNFDKSARKRRGGALRQERGAMPPFMQAGARTQQKWVGSPPAMLPPDGDYPGGSTGIQQDGYIAYETGWANDGPFHGEQAPLQEAGIAKSPVAQNLRQAPVPHHAQPQQLPHLACPPVRAQQICLILLGIGLSLLCICLYLGSVFAPPSPP